MQRLSSNDQLFLPVDTEGLQESATDTTEEENTSGGNKWKFTRSSLL